MILYRINSEQNSFHLDTSTETEMFVGRAGHHQTSSDWADAADREVNNVMELRSYQQQHQQQWYKYTFCLVVCWAT